MSDAVAAEPQEEGLKKKAVRGSAFTLGTYVLLNIQRFAVNLIVARLLVPEDFGLAALLNVLMAGLHLFSDVGIGPALIQNKRGEEESFLRTAFTLQAGRGVFLFLGGCAIAWPASVFYDEPRLLTLVPLVATTGFIEGLRSTAFFRLMRHMRVGTLSLLETGRGIVSAATMVIWAYVHPSVYALIAPYIVGVLFDTVVSHFLMRDRIDRFGWSNDSARELFSFGRWVFISTALTFGATSLDRLVLPKLFSLEIVGIYQIALMLASLPALALLSLGSRIVFPALSRVASEIDLDRPTEEHRLRFQSAFDRVRGAVLVLGGYAVAGMVGTGDWLIRVAYPPEFELAGPLVQVLAIASWFHLMEAATGSAMLAQGKPRYTALSTGTKVVLLFLLVPLLAQLGGGGIFLAVVAVALADLGRYVASVVGARRLPVPLVAESGDLRWTGLIALSAGAGLLVGEQMNGDLASFFVSGVVVSLFWLMPALRAVRNLRG